MKPRNIRLSDALEAKLLARARERSLSFSAFLRSQLEVVALEPHDITKTAARADR